MTASTFALPATIPLILSGEESTLETAVGSVWSVAIGGIGFMIDPTPQQPYRWGYLPWRREQRDQGTEPGEQTLVSDFWRRARSTWHHGAGQTFADSRQDTNPNRFLTSKGVDVWTENKLSLLPATELKRASASTNLKVLGIGTRLYITDGTGAHYADTPTDASPTFTALTGLSGTTVKDIATDGTSVYVSDGTRIKSVAIGSAATANFDAVATNADEIGIANGFFLAGVGPLLYVLDSAGARTDVTPAQVPTVAGGSWVWTGFATAEGGPYAGGYANGRGAIYRGIIDGTGALTGFEFAAPMPDGEEVRCLVGYLNSLLFIGTNKGVRMATIGDQNAVSIGPLIDLNKTVRDFEPEANFVWFTWPTYDTTSTGIGRLDPAIFPIPLRPAYATDLMYTSTADTLSVTTAGTRRYFAVSGIGFVGETANKVASGTIESGKIRWAIPENKAVRFIEVTHEPLDGAIEVSTAVDEGSYTLIGGNDVIDTLRFELPTGVEGDRHEMRLTLTRSATDTTLGPVVTSWIIKATPLPRQQRFFEISLLCQDEEQSLDNQSIGYPGFALTRVFALQDLVSSQVPVAFQGIDYGVRLHDTYSLQTYSVVVEQVEYHHFTAGVEDEPGGKFGGKLRVFLREQ